MHDRRAYVGRVCGKNGRTLFKSKPHALREAAAAECFAAKPRVRQCSTNEVSLRALDGKVYVLDASRDIRWHRKPIRPEGY